MYGYGPTVDIFIDKKKVVPAKTHLSQARKIENSFL